MNSGDLKRFVEPRRNLLIGLALAAATLAVYWQVSGFEFTNYDDFVMILRNPYVLGGLTREGVWWGLTTTWFDPWHPLTWWSHMLDCELFGLNAGGHHMVSLGLHAANTVLVFVVLRRMTEGMRNGGNIWRCAVVAALFGLHPLHVEPVVWVASRKDVLSAFFFLLTLWAYAGYAEGQRLKAKGQMLKGEIGRQNPSAFSLQPSAFYVLTLGLFACGLMSKPMVVTLPFVLLLLDYWPLQRLQLNTQHSTLKTLLPLLREKVPFFLLSAASCVITYKGMKSTQSILSAEVVPWDLRVTNPVVSYVRYLGKLIWPRGLIVAYPLPSHWAWWQVAGALLVLLAISAVVLRRARSAPYWAVGWLMFLGMLVPVIGLIPVNHQSMSDRYMYLPAIGLFVAAVWGIAAVAERCRIRGAWVGGGAALALAACAWLTWVQASHWRNSITLWTHCLAVCPENYFARYNLGYALQHSNRPAEAIIQYREAVRLNSESMDANHNLGIALVQAGRAQEATNYLWKALRLKPEYGRAEEALALALYELGDYAGAAAHGAAAVRLDPEAFGPYVVLGKALSALGKSDEALGNYAEALRLNRGVAETHYYLGLEWMKRGAFDQAAASFAEAVRLAPGWAEAQAAQQRALDKIKSP